MKIAFIGGRDIFSVGGIENWMRHLPERLAQMGHEVIVYCESREDATCYHGDVKLVYVRAPRNRYFCKIFASYRATKMALREGCELIHYNVWPSALWSRMAEKKAVKTVLMGHGFEWKRSKYNRLQRYILRKMEGCAARRHKHIVLCSQEQTDWYIHQYGCAGKVVTIPSAVNLPAPTAQDTPKHSEADASSHARTILYMGRISPEKNVHILIHVFERVQKEHPQARLLIAGPMPLEQRYARKIRALIENNEHIEYVGEVSGAQKDALLRRVDLFCLPSSIEGLSIALLEAAAYKIPIIASDLRSNHEALDSYAFWVTPGDISTLKSTLLYTLSASEEQLHCHTASAYARVAEYYTWDKVAARYERYITEL